MGVIWHKKCTSVEMNQNEKNMMKKLTLLLLLFFVNLAYSQIENAVIEEVNGKKYYVHIVQGGNTLWGLSQLYKVDADKIIDQNPGAEKGIQLGQKLLIPMENTSTVQEPITAAPTTHQVVKGDNLYNISKRYGVSMEDIVKLNPGAENGITLGQEIKLPGNSKTSSNAITKTQVTFKDSIVEYTVLPHETLYTISKRFMVSVDEIKKANNLKSDKLKKNEIIKIPVKKETITKIEVRKIESVPDKKIDDELSFKSKNTYSIVYLLPFGLEGTSESLKGISTEFLMGAQLALDSLEKMGLNAKVQILDAPSDTIKLKKLLEEKNIKNADLIIGPFMGDAVALVAAFAKTNKIRMISPLNQTTGVLKDNPYVYNAVDSDITLMKGAAKYLVKKHLTDQIVLVKVDAKDDELYQAFRKSFMESLPKDAKFKLMECSASDLTAFIKKGGNTIFVVPSRDKGFAVKFINGLEKSSGKAGSGKIMVFGTKDWLNNDEIKGFYKNKFTLHVSSPYDFNYSYDRTKKLLRKYRTKYNADLSKYGAQGFDVSLYFIQNLLLEKELNKFIMNEFNMQRVANGSGYENKACFILKQENFDLIQQDLIHE